MDAEPEQTDHHGDAVEVALGDRGATDGRLHAATEHVGETAALPLVHQHTSSISSRLKTIRAIENPKTTAGPTSSETEWTTGA